MCNVQPIILLNENIIGKEKMLVSSAVPTFYPKTNLKSIINEGGCPNFLVYSNL